LGRGRVDIDAALADARTWLRGISSVAARALRIALAALGVALGRARSAGGERLADARWHFRDGAAERAERFRAWRHEQGTSPRGEGLGYVWWQFRKSCVDLAEAVRVFRAQHRRASTVAMLCLLASLALAGTGAAFLADSERSAAGSGNSTNYIVLTSPGGTRTYAVTVTNNGKKRTVLRVHGPGGVTTLRDTVSVDGPIQVLPGDTITARGPTKTVTVTAPGVTVTEVETLTETVVVLNEVTVTETVVEDQGD
jgi:hypothetical protein